MTPDELFLCTLDHLRLALSRLAPKAHADRTEKYELVMLAHLLRKLLVDGGSLVSLVNRQRRVAVRFPVAGWPFLVGSAVHGSLIAFKRRGLPPGMPTIPKEALSPEQRAMLTERQLRLHAVLKEPVLVWDETPLTVKGLITYVANIGGGVHVGGAPTGPVETALHDMGDRLLIDGYPLALACLWDVGEVVAKGLEPLRTAVARDVDSLPDGM